ALARYSGPATPPQHHRETVNDRIGTAVMSPIMKKISIAAVSILVCVAAAAQEHHHISDAEFLKMLGDMSTVGTTSTAATGVTVQSNATVTFGGVAATSVSVTSSTSITAVTPPSASVGAVPVVVKNGDGQSVSFSSFTYTLPGPSINSVSPATGPTNGGTTF